MSDELVKSPSASTFYEKLMSDAATTGTPLARLIHDRRVIVCCGAGGVGKTSVSAALALGAARQGRRVLVVTIDPSRRLPEILALSRNPPRPVSLPSDRLAAVGIRPPGFLDAWMLDPQMVADSVVRRMSSSEKEASSLLTNRIYRNVTSMVAGMQEYTAVEAIHGFIKDKRYDLIILDTPPSRNALHFLKAPGRITSFMDGRIFRFFLPGTTSLIKRATSAVLNKVLDLAFGQASRKELLTFFGLFSTILKRISSDAEEMRLFFQRRDVAFVVVTSPAQEALKEALYFEKKTSKDLKLNLSGYILNRSLAFDTGKALPDDGYFAGSAIPAAARRKLRHLAEQELFISRQHRELLANLRSRLGKQQGVFAEALPYLSEGVADMKALLRLVHSQQMDAV